MTKRDTAADHLTRAKAALVAAGWRQGMSHIPFDADDNTCCMMEALERTKLNENVQNIATMAICAAINGDPLSGYCEVIHWNDQPGRTQADVEEAYDKAINIAKEQDRAAREQE
jgi:hypothetical protein